MCTCLIVIIVPYPLSTILTCTCTNIVMHISDIGILYTHILYLSQVLGPEYRHQVPLCVLPNPSRPGLDNVKAASSSISLSLETCCLVGEPYSSVVMSSGPWGFFSSSESFSKDELSSVWQQEDMRGVLRLIVK